MIDKASRIFCADFFGGRAVGRPRLRKSVAIVFNFVWGKPKLFRSACLLIRAALRQWELLDLEIVDAPTGGGRFGSGGKYFGEYGGGRAKVNVAASTQPRRIPGRVWSFPGYKVDRTAAGIACHETGHHVWKQLDRVQKRLWTMLWYRTVTRVSGYESTPEEGFAESLRLFLLNPTLLQAGCPQRYGFLTGQLGLTPVVKLPWREVLRYAPKATIAAGARWAGEVETGA